MSVLTAEPTTRPRSASLEERSAMPLAPEKDEKEVNEGANNEAVEAPAPNERPDFAMTGNGESQPQPLNGNATSPPMQSAQSTQSPSLEPKEEEKEKEVTSEGEAVQKKMEGAATGGDEGTEGGEEGQGPPAAGDGVGGMAGDGESKPEAKKKEGAEGEKNEGEGEPASPEVAEKEGEDKKKITSKSPKEFQEAGQKADKDSAVPQVADLKKDKVFQGVIKQTKNTKRRQKTHQPASNKVTETQEEARLPVQDQERKNDQLGHMGSMNQLAENQEKKKEPFTPETFKKLLQKNLDDLEKDLPRNEGQAKEFKRDKPIEKVKESIAGQVKNENEKLSGPMASEAKQKDPPKSGAQTQEAKAIPNDAVGPAPKPISSKAAVPKKKNDSEISMEKESQSLDDYMAENEVTEPQLANSKEPKFVEALDSKKQAQTEAKEAPNKYRKKEKTILGNAQETADQTGRAQFQSMHGARNMVFTKVLSGQESTGKSDKDKQRLIFKDLENIYNKIKEKVTEKLDGLSERVDNLFSTRAETAKKTFEDNVEERLDDIYGFTVIDDWLFGEDTEAIEKAFQIEKRTFIRTMNGVLDDIARIIADELNATLKIIKEGKKKSEEYFNNLDTNQQKLAQDAFDNFNDQYTTLEETVYEIQKELASDLAQAYKENVDSLREAFDEIKERVSTGWIGAAFNFLVGVIKVILKIKVLLFNLLAAAIDAIGAIISDPIGFLSNLINGIKQGFTNFGKNLLNNIMTGLIEWLTGSLGGMGIKIPENLFSLSGIFNLVAQILGLTWDYFRMKAVKLLGEPLVNAMEKGFEIFQLIREKGIAGLWEHIKEQFTDLKEMVMDAIRDMIITKVIEAGIKWIMGLMSPAGAFIKAAMMIIDIVRFFIERAAQIIDLVQAFVDGIRALASGNVAAVAKAVEKALVKAIPVLIGFLAALVGITGLTDKIQKIIKRVRKRIDKAITKIIKKARKAFKKLVKKGKKKVKGAIGKVLNWLGIKKKFKTKDGKKHTLQMKGKKRNVELWVNTTPKKVRDVLDQHPDKSNPAWKEANKHYDTFYKSVPALEKLDKQYETASGTKPQLQGKIKEHIASITETLDLLSQALKTLGLDGKIEESVVTNIDPNSGTLLTFKKAEPLTALPGNTKGNRNAASAGDIPGWTYLRSIKDSGVDPKIFDKFVRFHIIHDQMHGPANNTNLVAATKDANNEYYRDMEIHILRKLYTPGTIMWLNVRLDYHESYPEFLEEANAEWGYMKLDPSTKKPVKDTKKSGGSKKVKSDKPPLLTGSHKIKLHGKGRGELSKKPIELPPLVARKLAEALKAFKTLPVYDAMDAYYTDDKLFLGRTRSYLSYLKEDKDAVAEALRRNPNIDLSPI